MGAGCCRNADTVDVDIYNSGAEDARGYTSLAPVVPPSLAQYKAPPPPQPIQPLVQYPPPTFRSVPRIPSPPPPPSPMMMRSPSPVLRVSPGLRPVPLSPTTSRSIQLRPPHPPPPLMLPPTITVNHYNQVMYSPTVLQRMQPRLSPTSSAGKGEFQPFRGAHHSGRYYSDLQSYGRKKMSYGNHDFEFAPDRYPSPKLRSMMHSPSPAARGARFYSMPTPAPPPPPPPPPGPKVDLLPLGIPYIDSQISDHHIPTRTSLDMATNTTPRLNAATLAAFGLSQNQADGINTPFPTPWTSPIMSPVFTGGGEGRTGSMDVTGGGFPAYTNAQAAAAEAIRRASQTSNNPEFKKMLSFQNGTAFPTKSDRYRLRRTSSQLSVHVVKAAQNLLVADDLENDESKAQWVNFTLADIPMVQTS